MGPKMPTEHAQMHAGKCEGVKSENPKGKGKLGNEKGVLTEGVIGKTLIKLIK